MRAMVLMVVAMVATGCVYERAPREMRSDDAGSWELPDGGTPPFELCRRCVYDNGCITDTPIIDLGDTRCEGCRPMCRSRDDRHAFAEACVDGACDCDRDRLPFEPWIDRPGCYRPTE